MRFRDHAIAQDEPYSEETTGLKAIGDLLVEVAGLPPKRIDQDAEPKGEPPLQTRDWLRWRPSAALVLVLTAAMSGLVTPSLRTEVAADANHSIDRAYADFEALASRRRAEGTMPRFSVPADRPVLEAMWDSKRLGTPPYGPQDLPPTIEVWTKQLAAMKTYVMFAGATADAPGREEDYEAFKTENLAGMKAILKTDVVLFSSVDAFLPRLTPQQVETRRQGLLQIRTAATLQILSATRILEDDVSSADKAAIAASLAEGGEIIAANVTPPDRMALADAARSSSLPFDSPLRPNLSRFIEALSITSCEHLCAFK